MHHDCYRRVIGYRKLGKTDWRNGQFIKIYCNEKWFKSVKINQAVMFIIPLFDFDYIIRHCNLLPVRGIISTGYIL